MALRRQLFRFVEAVPVALDVVLGTFLKNLIFAIGEDNKADRQLVRKGSATFVSSGTVTVTFDEALATTDYEVALGPQANEVFWATSLTATGFTLNSSNAGSSAVVSWIIRIEEET